MPAKKAAAKHADPKHHHPKHPDPKHHERKDLRRAFEHLGRVEILERSIGADSFKDVHTLVALAERQLGAGHRRDAADLLRAAEHFSFAVLAKIAARSGEVSSELEDVVLEEFEQLTRKAKEHWDESVETERHAPLAAIFRTSLEAAKKALRTGAYRQALELSRGAEALAHVRKQEPKLLGAKPISPKLARP